MPFPSSQSYVISSVKPGHVLTYTESREISGARQRAWKSGAGACILISVLQVGI